ncbi:MAG: lactonase family protein [Planctomycetales bacterium]|nr:lactonase family protein [Planctomycetales bacterium]
MHRLSFFLLLSLALATHTMAESIDVWIGTSNSKLSQGIYHCTLDTSTGKLSEASLAAEISGPGFLALHPSLPVLYAVGTLEGRPSVVAYQIKRLGSKPSLDLLGSAEIGDGGAAHVEVDPTGHTLMTAQYGGGSVGVFSLNADGSIRERTQLIKHQGGAKVVGNRQDSPHAHWVGFSPDNRFAFAPDLGLDQVAIYKLDAEKSHIVPHGAGAVPPGGGPRHMKFHQNGRWIYVLNELALSVSQFDYDPAEGTMKLRNTIPAVPQAALDKELFKSASEIRIHPNGRFAYSANRGHDTITAYRIDPKNGDLTVIEIENVRSATPRNFNLDPSGKWLVVGGQDSHTLASFAVNSETGELTYNQSIQHVPSPICVLFDAE